MKRLALLFLIVLLSAPLYGRGVHVEEIPEARAWATRVLRQVRDARRQRAYRAAAVASNRSARALLIPVAGNAPGAFGTHFRSDVTIANWNANAQTIGILWLPNGNPAGLQAFRIRVEGERPTTYRDFVGTELGVSGAGSLILLPISGTGDLDPHGAIDAYSRIWTPQPNASGTVSQPFPGVDPDFLTEEREAVILGLRQDPNFRTNFGLVNLTEEPMTFTVAVVPEEGQTVQQTYTIPALSMLQGPIPAGTHNQLSLRVTVNPVPTFDYSWMTYASSTDNITGDGWVSIGANAWDDEELEQREEQ